MVRMLDEEASSAQPSDTPVTYADQQHINAFSRLNSRTDEIIDELESLEKQQEDLDEVEGELQLLDEDEQVMYKLDSTFLHLPVEEALSHLAASLEKVRTRTDKLREEKEECRDEMERLKKELYAKFGNSINLERD
ncbi:hypothetical protein JCM10212_000309 [Sporobolomyces blumeae]